MVTVSRDCSLGNDALLPGRLVVFNDVGSTEHLQIDARSAERFWRSDVANPSVEIRILNPSGVRFIPVRNPASSTRYEADYGSGWEPLVAPATHTKVTKTVTQPLVRPGHPGDALTFTLRIQGRAGRPLSLEIVVRSEELIVEARSCDWRVDEWNIETESLAGPAEKAGSIVWPRSTGSSSFTPRADK